MIKFSIEISLCSAGADCIVPLAAVPCEKDPTHRNVGSIPPRICALRMYYVCRPTMRMQ